MSSTRREFLTTSLLAAGLAPHLDDVLETGLGFDVRVMSKRPEIRADLFEERRRQRLVGKIQHRMPRPGRPQVALRIGAERRAEVEATHGGGEALRFRDHGEAGTAAAGIGHDDMHGGDKAHLLLDNLAHQDTLRS